MTELDVLALRVAGSAPEIVAGDWVVCQPTGARVVARLPRAGAIARKRPGRASREQVLCANVDVAFIVTGLDDDFSVRRIERYLTIAAGGGADAVLVLTKSDLSDDVEARARECLERVGLAELGNRRPSELSGGQKQRVAIARALFNEPELHLCDEPTGNLATKTGRSVIEFFSELNETDGVTLIIVTHERRVSSVAKRIIRMEDGCMIEGADVSDWIDDAAEPGPGDEDDDENRAAGGEA
jgi:ABC-type sugar transport system ATPase subunit